MSGPTKQATSSFWQRRVERWARLSRIIVTMLVTIFLVAALWLLVTLVFGVDTSSSALVRLLIVFGGGIAAYVWGWWVLVGFEDTGQGWHASPHTLWYLLAGLLALGADVAIIVIELASTSVI